MNVIEVYCTFGALLKADIRAGHGSAVSLLGMRSRFSVEINSLISNLKSL